MNNLANYFNKMNAMGKTIAGTIVTKIKMVGRVRLERTTNWLKANCSTD